MSWEIYTGNEPEAGNCYRMEDRGFRVDQLEPFKPHSWHCDPFFSQKPRSRVLECPFSAGYVGA